MAYFQQGVSNFLIGNFEEALTNFNDTLLYLRGNSAIDYEQLGLNFKLFSCEVLFNRGLCYIYLQQKGDGMRDFAYAVKEKVVDVHNVIDEAIQDEAEVSQAPFYGGGNTDRIACRLNESPLDRATRSSPFPSGSSTDPTAPR